MTSLPLGELRCRAVIDHNPNMLVPWYLMASYLYYHRDESLLLDTTFDVICRRLLTEWDAIKHHHLCNIHTKELSAGTCFLKESEFPTITKAAACDLVGIPFVFS